MSSLREDGPLCPNRSRSQFLSDDDGEEIEDSFATAEGSGLHSNLSGDADGELLGVLNRTADMSLMERDCEQTPETANRSKSLPATESPQSVRSLDLSDDQLVIDSDNDRSTAGKDMEDEDVLEDSFGLHRSRQQKSPDIVSDDISLGSTVGENLKRVRRRAVLESESDDDIHCRSPMRQDGDAESLSPGGDLGERKSMNGDEEEDAEVEDADEEDAEEGAEEDAEEVEDEEGVMNSSSVSNINRGSRNVEVEDADEEDAEEGAEEDAEEDEDEEGVMNSSSASNINRGGRNRLEEEARDIEESDISSLSTVHSLLEGSDAWGPDNAKAEPKPNKAHLPFLGSKHSRSLLMNTPRKDAPVPADLLSPTAERPAKRDRKSSTVDASFTSAPAAQAFQNVDMENIEESFVSDTSMPDISTTSNEEEEQGKNGLPDLSVIQLSSDESRPNSAASASTVCLSDDDPDNDKKENIVQDDTNHTNEMLYKGSNRSPLVPVTIHADKEVNEFKKFANQLVRQEDVLRGANTGSASRVLDPTTVLGRLQRELESRPGEDHLTDTPDTINIDLMPHQKQALSWLRWREQQECSGGILADDMGLGKTLSMISLICAQKAVLSQMKDEEFEQYKQHRQKLAKEQSVRPSNCTLVVVPVSLLKQWEEEIRTKVSKNYLNVVAYYGKEREHLNVKSLARADVVLTTYGVITSEIAVTVPKEERGFRKRKQFDIDYSSTLASIYFNRIILDEAHNIKNKQTDRARACCALLSCSRWALTGTPVQNNIDDFYSLVRFLRYEPFCDLGFWKQKIQAVSKSSKERMSALVQSIMLHRTKDAILKDVLPTRTNKLEVITMSEVEKSVYRVMLKASQMKLEQFLQGRHGGESTDSFYEVDEDEASADGKGTKKDSGMEVNPFGSGPKATMHTILVVLLRLRQAAVHFCLIRDGVDMSAFDGLSGSHLDEKQAADADELLNASLTSMTDEEKVVADHIFHEDVMSSKMKAVLDRIQQVHRSGKSVVVVSQWTKVLDLVGFYLQKCGIRWTELTGRDNMAVRDQNLTNFKSGSVPGVLLLSLTAGGCGLNLTSASDLIMIDAHWNPQLEEQAFCRVYRIGQKKDVTVHRFVTASTIEERVLALQEKKIELAKQVMSGKIGKNVTIEDLRFLFEIGDVGGKAREGKKD